MQKMSLYNCAILFTSVVWHTHWVWHCSLLATCNVNLGFYCKSVSTKSVQCQK